MIRKYNDKDYGTISEIYNLSKLDELLNEKEAFELLPLEMDKGRLKSLQDSNVVVFDIKGIAGFGSYKGNEITGLFVHPDSRGKGIGRILLDFLLKQVGSLAMLSVAKSNHLAIGFYEAVGFIVTSEFETTYNGVPVLANEMVRKIRSD